MKSSTAHLIENLANELKLEGICGKKITIVLRSRDNEIKDRPNALILTRGKNGWTKCKQDEYYSVNIPTNYREYTDDELIEIVNQIRQKGVFSKSEFGGWYEVNN